jgi:hypothetical protein
MILIKRNIKNGLFKKLFMLAIFTLLGSCGNDSGEIVNPPSPIPQSLAPSSFGLTSVSNGAINIDVEPTFNWAVATDPDGDTVTYDFYLDTNEDPSIRLVSNISGTNYEVQNRLNLVNQYYWKVIAKHSKRNTTSSNNIFSFTARNLNFPSAPITANAEFSKRTIHTTTIFDDKIWLI